MRRWGCCEAPPGASRHPPRKRRGALSRPSTIPAKTPVLAQFFALKRGHFSTIYRAKAALGYRVYIVYVIKFVIKKTYGTYRIFTQFQELNFCLSTSLD